MPLVKKEPGILGETGDPVTRAEDAQDEPGTSYSAGNKGLAHGGSRDGQRHDLANGRAGCTGQGFTQEAEGLDSVEQSKALAGSQSSPGRS